MNSAEIKVGVQMFLYVDLHDFGSMPQNCVAGSLCRTIFSFSIFLFFGEPPY
jgi:hypothetical protein